MTDPDLEPLDRDMQDLFAAERDRPKMRDLDQAGLLARVNATLGLVPGGGPGEGGGPTGGPIPTAGLGMGGLLSKLGAGVVALAAIVGAGVHLGTRWDDAPPAMIEAPAAPRPPETAAPLPAAPPPSAAVAIDAPLEPIAAPTSVSAVSGSSPPPGASTRAETDPPRRDADLAAERAVLDPARSSVARGETGAAIAALERHAREFPRGRLSEEREGLWIQALVGAGRLDEARGRASRFKKTFPRSMLLPAFESALGSIP